MSKTKPDFDKVRALFEALPEDQRKALLVEELNKIAPPPEDEGYSTPYRKRETLPDPTKSHRANVNQTKILTGLRFEEKTLKEAKAAAKKAGISFNKWAENAILQHLALTH